MAPPSTLSLFGVIHVDDPEKVRRELDVFATDADAIFVEYPVEDRTLRDYGETVLRAPAFLLGLCLTVLFQGILYLAFVHDIQPAEFVAAQELGERHGVPVHPVDDDQLAHATDVNEVATALNWLVVIASVALAPIATGLTAALLLVGALVPIHLRRAGYRVFALAVLAVAIVAFAASYVLGVLSVVLVVGVALAMTGHVFARLATRNASMLDRIESIAADSDYDDAVLVTGKGHLAGLRNAARARDVAVPSIHVSYWRDVGETRHDPASQAVPGFEDDADATLAGLVASVSADGALHARRAGAALVDTAIVSACWLLALLAGYVVATLAALGPIGWLATAYATVTGVSILLAYYVGLESRFQSTVGKRLATLELASTDGTPVTRTQILQRNALRPVDALGLYLASLAATLFSDRNQSVGDLLARTRVRREEARALDPPSGPAPANLAESDPARDTDGPDDAGE